MIPTQRFDMPLPQGLVRVDLPCTEPGNPIAQARALAAALPALRALEMWLGTDLPCPEPASAPIPASASNSTRTADARPLSLGFHPASPLQGGLLLMPWAAVPITRLPPADLPCQWPKIAAQLCVQTLPLQRIVSVELVAGAVLLLPAAFTPPWTVRLRPAGGSGGPPAHWLANATWLPHDGQLLTRAAETSITAVRDSTWSVWLSEPVPVDLRAWLGSSGQHSQHSRQGQAQTQTQTHADRIAEMPVQTPDGQGLAAELRCGNQPVARGRLLPLGSGWGLRIEHIESLAPAGEASWT